MQRFLLPKICHRLVVAFNMRNTIVGFVSIVILFGGVVWFAASRQSSPQDTTAPISQVRVSVGAAAPEATFTDMSGVQEKLSHFKGQKVMLWLVATWCSSCSEGAKVLSQNENKLGNLTIITLKTYGNAGYPGPSIKEFATQSAPKMLSVKNWHWGDLTQQSARVYNPRNYPDIYFLIDKNGIVREINDAPAATIGDILKFTKD